MPNKVKFRLKKACTAKATIADDGTVTYGLPVRVPGACAISLDSEGEMVVLKADGIDYYVGNDNNGYSGDLEMALIPEFFRKDYLGETLDANGVLLESNTDTASPFALLFEFEGDVKNIRHAMYLCYASRPKIEGENGDKKDAKTETVSIKSVPREDGKIKAKTGDTTTDAVYNAWYNSVYEGAALTALYFDVVAGSVTGKTKVTDVVGEGSGSLYYKVGTSLTAPIYGEASTGYTALTLNTDITAVAGNQIVVVEVVDSKVVAASAPKTVVVA